MSLAQAIINCKSEDTDSNREKLYDTILASVLCLYGVTTGPDLCSCFIAYTDGPLDRFPERALERMTGQQFITRAFEGHSGFFLIYADLNERWCIHVSKAKVVDIYATKIKKHLDS